jgi:hypothetical protein
MTPRQTHEIWEVVVETLLYGSLVALFCLGTIKVLERPLQTAFQHHRIAYGFAALGLMIVQGFVLERVAHAIYSRFRPNGKVRS